MSPAAEIMLRIESLILRGENVSIEGEGDANRHGGWRMVIPPQATREVALRIVQFDKLFLDTAATYVERNKIRVSLNGTVLTPDIIRELRRRDLSEILGEVVPHQIDGPFHTALGLTPGDVLTAITPTSIGFAPATGGLVVEDAIDDTQSSTTSKLWVQKLRLTTSNLVAGRYRIGYQLELQSSVTGRNSAARIQVDDIALLSDFVTDETGYVPYTGFDFIDLTAGVHTVDIDFAAPVLGVYTAYIQRARIELWRVG